MKAETKRLGQSPSKTDDASHESLTDQSPQRMLPQRSSAWDPFEVWRTRVKPAQTPGDATE